MPKTIKCGFDDTPTSKGCELLELYGPTLSVQIGFDPAYNNAATGPPSLPGQPLHALVDTGATESCIDSALATALNLPIVDRVKLSGAGGQLEVNRHLAQVHIPSLKYTIYGSFAGVHLSAGGQPHVALIGRTFLSAFTMVYEGTTGTVTLTRP